MADGEWGSWDRRRRGHDDEPRPRRSAATADPDLPAIIGAHRVKPAKDRRGRSFWIEFPVLIVIALTIALLVKSFVVQAFFIPSQSMENTLLVGDKVLVNKLVYDIRAPARGDIIVFDGGSSWCLANPSPCPATGAAGSPRSSSPLAQLYHATLGRLFRSIAELFGSPPGQTDFIKRVIAVPGDRVACCTGGLVTVNGIPLHEASYLHPGNLPSQYGFSDVVPPGRLWVMGDFRSLSGDSRLHHDGYPGTYPAPGNGTIPENMVIGRAFVIVWPLARWRLLPVPPTFGQPALHRSARGAAAMHAAASAAVREAAAALAPMAAGGLPVRPAGAGLPLGAGLVLAIPLTLLLRRARLRLQGRRDRLGS
jgi:signal peptidase I